MSEKMSENRNKDLRAVDCCGMRVRNDGGPSAERNLLPWMPDRVGHDMELGQNGRSMVEMLGSMAIVGVLSVGAIGGYSYAMNKHRTNELIYEATKRAQWVGTQLELNNSAPSLNTFGTDSFGFGSFSGIDNNLPNANQFGIQVSDLNKSVCDNLVNHLERTGVIRDVTNVDCQAGTATLVFNRDLSTSDSEITPDEPEVSGEVSAQASTEVPTTQDPDEVHCSGNGSWNGSSCTCDYGWGGDDCSLCSGHSMLWAEYGWCSCDDGWDGEDCSINGNITNCSGNGIWHFCGAYCECNSGYTGGDCSEEGTQEEQEETIPARITDPEESTLPESEVTGPAFNCNGHGDYYGGRCCNCYDGWNGCACDEDKRNACGEHGVWIDSSEGASGSCSCESGYTGPDCAQLDHPCNGHGTWIIASGFPNGLCSCDSGWYGSNCTSQDPCGEHGHWCGSFCRCDSGWDGSDCSVDTTCNGHGHWCGSSCSANHTCCYCDYGWGGINCSVENPCNGHGWWANDYSSGTGSCRCDSGWGGNNCSINTSCSGNGTWIHDTSKPNGGFCQCDTGWGGSDCSEDHTCSGHGDWPEWYGACICNVGWGGSDCSEDHRNDCGEHGSYVCGAYCLCDSGYGGSDCSIQQ